MSLHFGLLLQFAILAASAPAVRPQATVMNWTIDGTKRQALVFAPKPGALNISHPLVFGFHGHGGNMQAAAQGMHMQELWPDAIVVYAQGLPTVTHVDPEGVRPGWQNEAGQNGDRDLKRFDAMLATMRQQYSVDDARIYSTGFSNGAGFTYLLWSVRGGVIAAIGECAGRLFLSDHPAQPRAVLAIAGQADIIDPFPL